MWRNGLAKHESLTPLLVCFLSCASVSTSATHVYSLGASEIQVSARAERGLAVDRLFIIINGVDVAEGPFGPEQATGTVLRGDYDGLPVEAHCRHRWRPGIHIGYQCSVRVDHGSPIELAF